MSARASGRGSKRSSRNGDSSLLQQFDHRWRGFGRKHLALQDRALKWRVSVLVLDVERGSGVEQELRDLEL
jgi:hypothetical protein